MKNSIPVRSLLVASVIACSAAATTLFATTENGTKAAVTDAAVAPPASPTQAAPPDDGNPPPPPPPPGGGAGGERPGGGRQGGWRGDPGQGPQGEGEGRPGREGGRFGGGQGGPGGNMMIPVGRSMNAMNRAITRLSGQINDASKKDENLMLIGEAERSCVSAKMAPVPQKYLDSAKDDAGKNKIKAEFHAHLLQALKMMIETEESIVADNPDAAKTSLDKLVKYRDDSHATFGVKDDDEPQ
ncbi:MAG TPA: hypothetical protein VG711_08005 [Phycisphaerales bacterium]|nr:hypothetical protein [Phycisphaerales bacterium]